MNSLMVKKKYVLVGGYLKGRYISAGQLLQLYSLPKEECILVDESNNPGTVAYQKARINQHGADMLVLHPKEDGNYSITESTG
jgi:hypothetical protein